MANNRRMFSNRITGSGKFLTMPPSSQALYFHLGMHADDDGVVEAYQVIKLTDSKEDDMKVLVSKDFVKILNEDMVVVILDWAEHNLIRPDRKTDSIHKSLLLKVIPEIKLIAQKPRSDTGKFTGRPLGDQRSAQVKLREVKLREENTHTGVLFEEFREKYPRKENMKKAREKWLRLSQEVQSTILKDIDARKNSRQWKAGYIPHATTYLNGERWNDELEIVKSNSITIG